MTELRQSLQKANDLATGLDQVHYQLLTHIPDSAVSILLKVYSDIWESGCFLPSWHEAVVIPIHKPGKDHSDPGNFRPIALTSSLCKTMERMLNTCLMWSLESQGLLSEKQCCFRKNHIYVGSYFSFWNVGQFWNNWIRSTIRACELGWVLSAHLLLYT